ncbi:DUF4143 domain-containing protein [Nakamurella lactea]|uniref:DUF4143 domain-containing protein n=1 Tax=Nakamurella lactea TaxID=459515 RepID=UPI00040F50CA
MLGIRTVDELLGHPAVGGSCESLVVETLIAASGSGMQPYHCRTARGDEIDLVLVQGGRPSIAVEVKRSTAPSVGAGFRRACDDLAVDRRFVVHPDAGGEEYSTSDGVNVIGLAALVARLQCNQGLRQPRLSPTVKRNQTLH